MENLFQNIPDHLPDELIEKLYQKSNIKIERIISRGHSSPENFWYDQDQDEFVLIIAGSATIAYDTNRSFRMVKGDYLLIPAHQKHRVEETSVNSDTVWLAFHF